MATHPADATKIRSSFWRQYLAKVCFSAVVVWIGPLATLIRNDQDRLAFFFWPLVYTAVAGYLVQPGKWLENRYSQRWGKFHYNAHVASLFFLCIFEVMANCLAPPIQRLSIAAAFFLCYVGTTTLAHYAEFRIKGIAKNVEIPVQADPFPDHVNRG